MDAKEYQELKQRRRKKAREGRRVGVVTIIFAGLVVFLLGITGGLLVSANRGAKAMRSTGSNVLRDPMTNITPSSPPPPRSVSATETEGTIMQKHSLPKRAKETRRADQEPADSTTTPSSSRTAAKTLKKNRRVPFSLRVSPYFPSIHNRGRTEDTMAYASLVQSLIELNKVDPVRVQRQPENPCTIVCILKRDGRIKHAEVVKSSGDPGLDAVALRSVRNTRRFPAVPESIQGDEVSFDLPVAFRRVR